MYLYSACRAANPKHRGSMALWGPVKRGSRTRLSYKTMSSGIFDSYTIETIEFTATASNMVKIVFFIIVSLLSLALSAPVEKAEDLASSDKEDLQTAASHFGPYGYGFGGYRYGGYYGYPYYSYYGYPGYGYGGLYGGFPYGYYGHGFWW